MVGVCGIVTSICSLNKQYSYINLISMSFCKITTLMVLLVKEVDFFEKIMKK